MPVEVVTTPYGRPALDALRHALAAAKGGDPLAPVTVVVPSNHVGVAARRLLASGAAGVVCPGGRGLAGVAFLTPYRLAELLGAARLAGEGRRPVSTPVVAAALRRALAGDPGMFAPVAQHPATETALVAAFTELSDVSDAGLDALAGGDHPAADVVRLCRQARAALLPRWYDEVDLVGAAVAALAAGVPLAGELGHVVVHLVQDLTQRQARLLRAVAAVAPVTAVAPLTGVAAADAGVARSLHRLGCPAPAGPAPDRATATVERAAGCPPVAPGRTRIVTASDADDEVRAAVRAVVDAARRGTPLERIAVLYGTAEPYGRLVHEHLAAAGIARNGAAVRPLAASVAGRTLLDLLALPDHRFRRADVMGLLAGSALRTPDGAPAPTGAWERLTREAGVVAGRDDWNQLLDRLATGLDARAADAESQAALADDPGDPPPAPPSDTPTAEPDGPPPAGAAGEGLGGRAAALRRRAERVRDLGRVVVDLIDDLAAAAAGPRPWRARVGWLRNLGNRFLGGERQRSTWPAGERKAADVVDAALDRLAALDTIDAPPALDVFRRTLALELDADLGRVGRFGEGVLVAPLSFAAGLDLDLVVVLGLAEGTLPGPVRDDSLLPDRVRRRAGDELPLRQERVGRDQRRLWAALAGAERHLLCAPRGDLRASNERVPSRWLLAAAGALHGAPVTADELPSLDHDWLEQVPSFAHGVTHAPFPATEQDYRLRAGGRRAPDPIAVAGAEVVRARRSRAFTRFDGNLSGAAPPSPTDTIVSATRLEAWATCPYAYFVRYLLGVDAVDDPERQLAITALDRGSLVHEVLERFVRAVVERAPADRPAPSQPWTPADREAMAAIASEVCDDYEARGLTGRPVFWRRDRAQILALVDRFLYEDDDHRRTTGTRPVAAELTFGRSGAELGPVEMALTDGRHLQFRGAIDRIDLADDGTLHVTDYKTGGARSYATLGPDDPDLGGTKLQLAVYGQAARLHHGRTDAPVRAEYWFVSDRENFTRRGYPVDDAVLGRVAATLTTIVHGIEQGVFPARPDDSGVPWVVCEFCDPDALGVADLRRGWELRRDDPAVAPYAQLVEPR